MLMELIVAACLKEAAVEGLSLCWVSLRHLLRGTDLNAKVVQTCDLPSSP